MSIKHLKELQVDIDGLYSEGKISDNETFQSYVGSKKYQVTESFPDAKYVVVLAIFNPNALVNFHYKGKKYEIIIPSNYYNNDYTKEQIEYTVLNKIIRQPGFRIENVSRNYLLKRLAVRSDLAKYGRNNITYVGEMGSSVTLSAYLTDYDFEEDNWTDVQMMDLCDDCKICLNRCPTGSISEESFIIDITKCIPLFNEVEGEFPDAIPADAHNALVGCMRCQDKCPGNRESMKRIRKLEDVTEEETTSILEGTPDEALVESLTRKLRGFPWATKVEYIPMLMRNLRVLIDR
ncbi:MAG: 4Fe-4S double cluster binding domain-containing protein [Candidatus Thorarchaeota archaeon]